MPWMPGSGPGWTGGYRGGPDDPSSWPLVINWDPTGAGFSPDDFWNYDGNQGLAPWMIQGWFGSEGDASDEEAKAVAEWVKEHPGDAAALAWKGVWDYLSQAANDTADTVTGLLPFVGGALAPSTDKKIRSLEQQLADHEKRLADYKANPGAQDNKGFLKYATPEQREKIIQRRINRLQGQIDNFKRVISSLKARR